MSDGVIDTTLGLTNPEVNVSETSFIVEDEVVNTDIEKVIKPTQDETETSLHSTEVRYDDNQPQEEIIVIKQSEDYSKKIEKHDPEYDSVLMPSTIRSDLEKQLSKISDKDPNKDSNVVNWLSTVMESDDYSTFEDGLAKAVIREDSLWEQGVDSPIGKLKPAKPSFPVKTNAEYTGEALIFRFKEALGMGTAFTIPLWHSGFWITIKTPSESDLLELYREITTSKVTLGRSSYGLMFSNLTSYTYSSILNFVIRNSYGSTLKLNDGVDIREYIDQRDLMPLFLGLTRAVWPKGVEYKRGCVADPDDCNYITEERLDPAKLLWVDTTKLTERQRIHMTKRSPNKMTLEEVNLYKSEITIGTDTKVVVGECEITFKTPNAAEFIESGLRWVGVLENRYTSSLLEDPDEREKYLFNQAKATALRQYTHYVKEIKTGELVVSNIDTIEQILDILSSEDNMRNLFFEKIAEYIDSSVLSIVGIPTFKCPNCGKEHSPYKDKGIFSTIIPIDVVTSFFILLTQKVQRIEIR